MDYQNKVIIIGAGELGTAIGTSLSHNKIPISFWDTAPDKVQNQQPLESLVPNAHAILFCVPSWGMRQALNAIAPFLSEKTILVSFAKGMEETSLKTPDAVLDEIFPTHTKKAIACGPLLAEEISANKKAIGIFASHDESTLKTLFSLFTSENFVVEISLDPASIALASVLKNIYAVSLGIADGLERSGNEKGWLTARAIQEMQHIAKILNCDPDVILSTAGTADLIATGYSSYSRNRKIGSEIVQYGKCNLRGEGLSSLPALLKLLQEQKNNFPILKFIQQVGIECIPAKNEFEKLFDQQTYA